jgi:hypothetical protein
MLTVTSAPTQAPVEASLPRIAGQFALIMANLITLVAARLRGNPRLIALNIPVWTWLTHAAARFARHMVRIAANRPARRRRSQPTDPDQARPDQTKPERPQPDAERPAPFRFPTTHAWLIHAIGFEAAGYGSQLTHLFAEPGVPEFLDAHPELRRLLRPIGRALGIDALVPKRSRPKPAATKAATTEPAAPARKRAARPRFTSEPLHPDPDYRPSAKWPAACLRRFKPA